MGLRVSSDFRKGYEIGFGFKDYAPFHPCNAALYINKIRNAIKPYPPNKRISPRIIDINGVPSEIINVNDHKKIIIPIISRVLNNLLPLTSASTTIIFLFSDFSFEIKS
jgi:hypothetical protein